MEPILMVYSRVNCGCRLRPTPVTKKVTFQCSRVTTASGAQLSPRQKAQLRQCWFSSTRWRKNDISNRSRGPLESNITRPLTPENSNVRKGFFTYLMNIDNVNVFFIVIALIMMHKIKSTSFQPWLCLWKFLRCEITTNLK